MNVGNKRSRFWSLFGSEIGPSAPHRGGDGTQTRDFTYVTDAAEAFLAAAESPVNQEVINIGSGDPRSVNEIVELLGGPVTFIPKRPGEPDCTMADATEAAELLGWNAKTQLKEGVAQLVQGIDYWRDAPVWTPEFISTDNKDWFRYLP